MRRLALFLSLVISGCGKAESPFTDEVDEFRYLSKLANPTPEQWARKREIAGHYTGSNTVEKAARARDAYDAAK